MTGSSPKCTNRLAKETSPYLLQHAHNPVDWYPWGGEALERAKKEDRLILLSIGYSACHWCHVMERESFENEQIAAVMNDHFVNVKVDREERPDLDDIYMAATLAMNDGQGGWPMTVFLTPDLDPVFAGTYFPPTDLHGRPGFPTVLETIARTWREERGRMRSTATSITEHLRQQKRVGPAFSVGETELKLALEQYAREFDATHGGFGSAPKFPPATGLSLLLRLHRRFGDPHALLMVRKTLDAMAQGGMYDHVGGGFARYSTDRRWLVPHFEKMLYDNALLAKVYIEGYQVTDDPFYARIATETLDYMLREMASPAGGIYSSTDADSEGEEGKFFVWTPDEIREVLDEEKARLFNTYYDITPAGNWEGKSIPNTPRPLGIVAEELGLSPESLWVTLDEARQKVYEARSRRTKPGLDDKILTAWNGMIIGALAEGYRVLRDPRYLEAGQRAAGFVLTTLRREDGGLLRTYRSGKAHLDAYLEDYAFLSEGLIDLFEVSGEAKYLGEAERLMDHVLADFAGDDTGAFYNTARQHQHMLIRYRDGSDGATPSSNAVAAYALARISYHLNREDLRAASVGAIKAYGHAIARYPRGFAKSLIVVELLLDGPVELALVGQRSSRGLEDLRQAVAKHFLPNRIEALLDPASPHGADVLPLLEGKTLVGGKAALYVCRDYVCQAPVTDPDAVAGVLGKAPKVGNATTAIGNRLAGRASADGTSRYAARFEGRGYTKLGSMELHASWLGFGGYRVDDVTLDHRDALIRALSGGANLIDTSTNYTDGKSERLVGSVLNELVSNGDIRRDEVVVVSKIGYVQGQNFDLARDREERGDPFAEMVKYDDGLWHCIHPTFLEDQFQRSLDRLELEALDICLLHNPEYFLSYAARNGESPDGAREQFYGRLREAFAYFEKEVAAGRLGMYGVSSNACVSATSDLDATSLTRMLQAASEAGGNSNHFRILQLPLNLFESGAVFEHNNGPDNGRTVLEVAQADGVAVLVNRPLNAVSGNEMVRLADVGVEDDDTDVDSQLTRVAELETAFRESVAPDIRVAPDGVKPADFFRWATRLGEYEPQIRNLEQWAQVEGQVNYTVGRIAIALDRSLSGNTAARWTNWRERYLAELDRLLRAMRGRAAKKANAQSVAVSAVLDSLLPEERRSETLSRKALWVVASTPGVTCVLNGMRTPEYVDDALGIMRWPKLEDVEAVYRAFEGVRLPA